MPLPFSIRLSHRLANGSEAPDQVKVASAEAAPAGLNQPLKGSFHSALRSHGSEIDGFAAWAAAREEPAEARTHHDHWASGLTVWDGIAEYAGRLASRAAVSCSGVLTSGSDSRSRPLARETWRLCRFCSLLSTDV
jgi:hypothetical protein